MATHTVGAQATSVSGEGTYVRVAACAPLARHCAMAGVSPGRRPTTRQVVVDSHAMNDAVNVRGVSFHVSFD